MRHRIVHVTAPAEVGGLERVVQALAIGQRRVGHEIHVAAVLDGPEPNHWLLDAVRAEGVVTHPLVLPARAYWAERRAIAELCRRIEPDVVHTHGYRPDVVDAEVARRSGIPVVTTVHGFAGGGWKNRLYERLQCRAFRKFEAVVAVSRALAQHLARRGVPAERIHVVPNAWHQPAVLLERAAARQILGIPERRFVIGWVGRLSCEKGLDVLLEALPHLADVPVVVSVLGTGHARAVLDDRARALRIGDRLTWHGPVADAARLFAAFDVFVLSSRTEGSPIVLFEAMAAGIPIVATRVGGVPDVVSSAEAALVPADDPLALAAGVRTVYRDRKAARVRAGRARERLQREFRVEPWLARYEAVYRVAASMAPASVAS